MGDKQDNADNDAKRAFQLHSQSASTVDSLFLAGHCYENGTGVTKNLTKAMRLYQDAADQGHLDAMVTLGNHYEQGIGVEKSNSLALRWYEEAAVHGDLHAVYLVGKCYENGTGVARDVQTAIRLYQDATERGHLDAMLTLGNHYEQGIGVEKDEEKAFQLYSRAASAGNLHAVYLLGKCYGNGIGVNKYIQKAMKLYRNAASRGHLHAMLTLGNHYEQGIGVERSGVMAAKLYEEAAVCGDLHAVYLLGKCYENGTGVSRDLTTAITLYQDATERGHLDAMVTLGRYYENRATRAMTHKLSNRVNAYDVFLVHAGEQKWLAVDTMKYILEDQGSLQCFLDREVRLGSPPHDSIIWALQTCRYIVVVLSRAFFENVLPTAELAYAFQRMRWIRGRGHDRGWKSLHVVLFEMSVEEFKLLASTTSSNLPATLCDEVSVSSWLGRAGKRYWREECLALKASLVQEDQDAMAKWNMFLGEIGTNMLDQFPKWDSLHSQSTQQFSR